MAFNAEFAWNFTLNSTVYLKIHCVKVVTHKVNAFGGRPFQIIMRGLRSDRVAFCFYQTSLAVPEHLEGRNLEKGFPSYGLGVFSAWIRPSVPRLWKLNSKAEGLMQQSSPRSHQEERTMRRKVWVQGTPPVASLFQLGLPFYPPPLSNNQSYYQSIKGLIHLWRQKPPGSLSSFTSRKPSLQHTYLLLGMILMQTMRDLIQ